MHSNRNDEVSHYEPTDSGDPKGCEAGNATGSEPFDAEFSPLEHGTVEPVGAGVADDWSGDAGSDDAGSFSPGAETTEIALITQQRSAPLPHPQEFYQYEQVLPGAADRIVKMAEDSLASTTYAQRAEARSFTAVSLSAASLPFALLLVSVVSMWLGHEATSIITAIPAAAALSPQIISAVRRKS